MCREVRSAWESEIRGLDLGEDEKPTVREAISLEQATRLHGLLRLSLARHLLSSSSPLSPRLPACALSTHSVPYAVSPSSVMAMYRQ